MDTAIVRVVRAEAEVMFELAAAVEDWPRLLPHYRWVRVLEQRAVSRVVEMAARRDVAVGLAVPLRWTAVQEVDRHAREVRFEHIAGPTRGMRVWWTFEPLEGGCLRVQIRHVFEPGWPVPGIAVRAIVGDYFVNGVAARTLRLLGELAESRRRVA
jgi:ribosome-associated toxin RatA of RatAB toxin-antitoxin module